MEQELECVKKAGEDRFAALEQELEDVKSVREVNDRIEALENQLEVFFEHVKQAAGLQNSIADQQINQ